MRTLSFLILVLLIFGCSPKEALIVEEEEPELPSLPGVDSVFVAMADVYASRGGLVSDQSVMEARLAVEGGRRLFDIADSLTKHLEISSDSVDVDTEAEAEAIRRFNEGAQLLSGEVLGLEELQGAAEQFRLALDANPYDLEASYWLSRVYELLYERLGQENALDEQIKILERLTKLHPERHDYAALLASAKESLGNAKNWLDSGAWWYRASVLLKDQALLSLDTTMVLDSSTAFIYLANSSRAFIEADQGNQALAVLNEADAYVLDQESRQYVESEREWLLWDTTVVTRKRFDTLLQTAASNPADAVGGMRALLLDVTRPLAKLEVRYQLARALYNTEETEEGISIIQAVWKEIAPETVPLRTRVQEDYGVMSYTLAMEMRSQGELRNALAYLLQSESTGFSQAARTALTLSLLLRNDPQASLEAAERAESGWESLDVQDQRTLLEHMVNLHRRLQNRNEAMAYVQRYRTFMSESRTN